MKPMYVEKGKLNADTFDLYFDCINEILEAEYILNDGMDLTYYDIMRKRVRAMSIAEYRANHRVYLEYLSKLTRMNLLDSFRKELLPQ